MSNQQQSNKITIIFDNGGGYTLQASQEGYQYQHCYEQGQQHQLANDIDAYFNGDDVAYWDGNDIDDIGLIEPTNAELSNGGYEVLELTCRHDIIDLAFGCGDHSSANVCELADALIGRE